jgi:hypothetical protein
MLDENEALRAERDQLRAEVKRDGRLGVRGRVHEPTIAQTGAWLVGLKALSGLPALRTVTFTVIGACLQSIYNDIGAPESSRIKAASAAIGYERPKLTFGVQISGPAVLGERLDQSRPMKTVNQPLLIEHQPK